MMIMPSMLYIIRTSMPQMRSVTFPFIVIGAGATHGRALHALQFVPAFAYYVSRLSFHRPLAILPAFLSFALGHRPQP